MVCHVEYILRIQDGKCVTVRKCSGEMKMYAVDQQEDEAVAHIWCRPKRNHISFCCHQGGDCYLPRVVGNNLTVEKAACCELSLSEDHWFEKVDLGTSEYYGLRSVAAPLWYLSISDDKLSISNIVEEFVPVTNEMKETSS